MTKKKVSNKKKKQHENNSRSRGLIVPISAICLTFAVMFGLVIHSNSSNPLVPLNQGNVETVARVTDETRDKTSKPESEPKQDKAPEKTAKAEEPSPSSAPEETPDPVESIEDAPAKKVEATPQSRLPRATLEHIAKGMQLTEQGKFNSAELEFEKAGELSPNSPEVFAIWAAALKMQKKYKGSNRRFEQAFELAPDDWEIAFNWGMLKLEHRHSDEAIELFQKTLELAPEQWMAYNYLGKAYGQKKMYAKETEMYEKTLEMQPDFAQAHFNLGVVLSLRNKVTEAAPHFEKAMELDKEFEKPFVKDMLKAMGRYKEPGSEETELQAKNDDAKDETSAKEDGEKEEEKKSNVKIITADSVTEGSNEGSNGKKMEGSSTKHENPTTHVKGRVLVNGEPVGANAVVILETKHKLPVPEQKVNNITIKQLGLQFSPKHSVVMVGSTVTFMNDDREVHNIYSKSLNNQFNLGAMAAGISKTMQFNEAGPVILRCNMHKGMIGTLFVVPNGHFAVTNEKGEFEFKEATNLEYLLQVWHPRLFPQDVERHMKSVKFTGKDEEYEIQMTSESKPGQIHDMVDKTDYKAIADAIEKEVFQAIEDWKNGKKYISRKRMLIAITKHYAGEGLKGALTKSFSEKRGMALEEKLDILRKKISGLGKYKEGVTEVSLKQDAKLAIAQLRNNIRELEARVQPDSSSKKEDSKDG